MNFHILNKDELIILNKYEVEEIKLNRCFKEYRNMVKTKNTIFIVEDDDSFVGIITLNDYLNNIESGNFINMDCKKIISNSESNAIAKAWELKKKFEFLKIIPVINSLGILLYGIKIDDNKDIEKDIRDFEFWTRENNELLSNKYYNRKICVIGEEPFYLIYVAKLLSKYLESVSLLLIGDKEWVFREKSILDICVADINNLKKYDDFISIDIELLGIESISIRMLSDIMYNSEIEKKHNGEKREIIWLHIGDILTPLEGKITAVQLFIISRILDVERRRGGKPFYWQNRFNEFFWPEMTREEEMMMEKRVDLLINSIRKRGFAPNTGAGSVTEYPFGMNDGAHRTAYHAVYSPNSFLPYYIGNRSLTDSFWPYNGVDFFKEVGLPIQEIEELKNRYVKLLKEDEVRTSLTGYIKKEYFNMFENIIFSLNYS